MGDLKIENLRLQKFADILDSQPELTFCVDKNGQITFMSDSASNSMKSNQGLDLVGRVLREHERIGHYGGHVIHVVSPVPISVSV